MQTKMKINIILYPKSREDFKSIDLYNKLKLYIDDVNVTDLGEKVYIFATIDLTKSEVEFLISECKSHGECDIEAHAVTEEAP